MPETILLCLSLPLPAAAAVIVALAALVRGFTHEARNDLRQWHGAADRNRDAR